MFWGFGVEWLSFKCSDRDCGLQKTWLVKKVNKQKSDFWVHFAFSTFVPNVSLRGSKVGTESLDAVPATKIVGPVFAQRFDRQGFEEEPPQCPRQPHPNRHRADRTWRASLRHLLQAAEGPDHLPDGTRRRHGGQRRRGSALVPAIRKQQEADPYVHQQPRWECNRRWGRLSFPAVVFPAFIIYFDPFGFDNWLKALLKIDLRSIFIGILIDLIFRADLGPVLSV